MLRGHQKPIAHSKHRCLDKTDVEAEFLFTRMMTRLWRVFSAKLSGLEDRTQTSLDHAHMQRRLNSCLPGWWWGCDVCSVIKWEFSEFSDELIHLLVYMRVPATFCKSQVISSCEIHSLGSCLHSNAIIGQVSLTLRRVSWKSGTHTILVMMESFCRFSRQSAQSCAADEN